MLTVLFSELDNEHMFLCLNCNSHRPEEGSPTYLRFLIKTTTPVICFLDTSNRNTQVQRHRSYPSPYLGLVLDMSAHSPDLVTVSVQQKRHRRHDSSNNSHYRQ